MPYTHASSTTQVMLNFGESLAVVNGPPSYSVSPTCESYDDNCQTVSCGQPAVLKFEEVRSSHWRCRRAITKHISDSASSVDYTHRHQGLERRVLAVQLCPARLHTRRRPLHVRNFGIQDQSTYCGMHPMSFLRQGSTRRHLGLHTLSADADDWGHVRAHVHAESAAMHRFCSFIAQTGSRETL